MDHFVVTRFNVGIYGAKNRSASYKPPPDPDAWVKRRLVWLEYFTKASLMKQSNPRFQWIVLVDPRTPLPVLRQIRSAVNPLGRIVETSSIRPIDDDPWIDKITSSVNFITTKLDSDDALHPTYIDRIYIKPGIISFPKYACWNPVENVHIIRTAKHLINFSVIDIGTRHTCYAASHTKLEAVTKLPVTTAETTSPMLCCTIHGDNMGTRFPPDEQFNGYPF